VIVWRAFAVPVWAAFSAAQTDLFAVLELALRYFDRRARQQYIDWLC
jgi:hypothetical protein